MHPFCFMTFKYLLIIFFSLLCSVSMQAQEEEDIEEEEGEEEEIAVNPFFADSANWTPNERWAHMLQYRLDSVLNSHKTATVTVKGKRGRRYKKTVTLNYKVGMHVYDMTDDSTLFVYNDNDLYIPASTQKLFVSITALSTLGPSYHFCTDVLIDGPVEVDTIVTYPNSESEYAMHNDTIFKKYLNGNVYVRGGFDPTLDENAVDFIAWKVTALDIDSINGYIYSYEPQKGIMPNQSWFWNKHHSRYFASSLYNSLISNGITFSTRNAYATITAPVNKKFKELTSLCTPLPVVLQRMMKNSDNFYAESMLLNLCNLRDTNTWTYDNCKQKVREMIKRAGGKQDDYVIEDGSGLSHSNKTTPSLQTTILRYAYNNKDVIESLYESLPIAGVDGTLSRRMSGTAAQRNVRAKTGTVNGVQTLSGYVKAPNGHLLVFSILVNNNNMQDSGRRLQDLLCKEMAIE